MNASSNSLFSRCINYENEPETFLYKPCSRKLPKFAWRTQQTALVSDTIVKDVPKTYSVNRAGRDLPNYIWTQLRTDFFPDTGPINAFSDWIRNHNKRSGPFVNSRRRSELYHARGFCMAARIQKEIKCGQQCVWTSGSQPFLCRGPLVALSRTSWPTITGQ